MSRPTEEQRELAKKEEASKAINDEYDLIAVLNLPQGRRFIKKLFDRAGFDKDIFTSANSDLYCNAKMRDFFWKLYKEIGKVDADMLFELTNISS